MRTHNPQTLSRLDEARMSKAQAFEGLDETFDAALPQGWLDQFVERTGLDYYVVLSTTVWSYGRTLLGEPVTCCCEVAQADQ